MRRVVSIFLPHWSTDRLRRKTAKSPPDGATAPLITAIPDHGRRIVAAADQAARALGIVAGMTITKARAFSPKLDVIDADPDADLIGLRRIALWAGRHYTPIVAADPPDGLWLDITGCAALFSTERAIANPATDLSQRLIFPCIRIARGSLCAERLHREAARLRASRECRRGAA